MRQPWATADCDAGYHADNISMNDRPDGRHLRQLDSRCEHLSVGVIAGLPAPFALEGRHSCLELGIEEVGECLVEINHRLLQGE